MNWFADVNEAALRVRFGEDEIDRLSERPDACPKKVLKAALEDARAQAGSYLARRYRLGAKVLATPQSLVRILCDLARYRLYDDAPHEEVEERYKHALEELNGLYSGKTDLFDPEPNLLAAWLKLDKRPLAASPKRNLFTSAQRLEGYPG